MDKYRHLQEPEAEFDFHDRGVLDGAKVKQMTEEFVRASVRQGLRRVRIVTGKGRRSQGAPLVGPQVRRTLTALQREGIVLRFTDSRVGEGGEGAVDVVLAE